ncbi:MAG: hypothetical protein K8T20_18310 [Planctomycetes bacterium]|nr:hypothetical protein [Planctomycetota bacterium]
MSVRCLCYSDFPPRDFQRLRDADEFSSRVRFSTNFMQIDKDGLRFGCRRCGQVWSWTLPDKPPFQWRPDGRTVDEIASVDPGNDSPTVWLRRKK